MFTKQEDMYFVDFANFARRNLPEGWNDDIGGTFQLLDGRWYNSSRQYWRGNFTYESPFILLKPLNRWLGLVQQERCMVVSCSCHILIHISSWVMASAHIYLMWGLL